MAREAAKEVVWKNVFALAKHPSCEEIEMAAKAAVVTRTVKKATRPDVEKIMKHAADYFRTHPSVDQLLYETYEKDGRRFRSSRERNDPPPDGVVISRCLAYRVRVGEYVRKAGEHVSFRWDYDPKRDRDMKHMRQLALSNA